MTKVHIFHPKSPGFGCKIDFSAPGRVLLISYIQAYLNGEGGLLVGDLTHSDPLKVGDEARLVVETLHHVTPRAEIVAVITTSDRPIPGFQY